MNARDEELKGFANKWREYDRVMVDYSAKMSEDRRQLETATNSRKDAGSQLLASVGANIRTRIFPVEGGFLLVEHEKEVRMVKVAP